MVRRFQVAGSMNHTFLKDVIDRQSVLKNQEKKKVRGSLYASDFGQCQRKVFFQFFPEKYKPDSEIDARTARIFDNGNAVHERLGDYLKREESLDFRDELDVPRDELDIHGRCDGICTVNDQAIVVEFKSINKDFVEEPNYEHVGQLTLYMGMMRKLRQDLYDDFGLSDPVDMEDLKTPSASGRILDTLTPLERWLLLTQGEIKGEIIYESKPTNEVYCFPLEWSEDKFKSIHLWFEQVKWHVDNNQVPNVKNYASKYPCSYGRHSRCPYYSICWGDNDGSSEGIKK